MNTAGIARKVAAGYGDIAAISFFAGLQEQLRTDTSACGIRPLQIDLDAISATKLILEDFRRRIQVVDDDIEIAIVVQVRQRHAPTARRVVKRPTWLRHESPAGQVAVDLILFHQFAIGQM